ncbi:hypothetical protein [Agarivorans sp. Z349TD_8]|uniref:hypothetical protein n=1 Tax=Agarivorans sp. Z349TD_8 TaxID=3421434 RepID=UPI003D7D36FA
MFDVFAFVLIGAVTGIGSSIMLLRFDARWVKAFSLSGGAGILIAEFVAFSELFGVNDEDNSSFFVYFLTSWLVVFIVTMAIALRSFKKQETKYKIQTWEILLGDKKAIDQYYTSKKEEISKSLEEQYNVAAIKEAKEELDAQELRLNIEQTKLDVEKKHLESIQDDVDEILKKKHKIEIPHNFMFPIKSDFFHLLPRYIKSISEFEHHLSCFTKSFIQDLNDDSYNDGSYSNNKILKTYLSGVCYYIGQYLFDWRDVRVHFRILNDNNNTYDKFIAVHRSGEDYNETLTEIPANKGLIALASESKRSVVYSANRKSAFDTGSHHIWTDYITMIFEKLHKDGKPVLSLGVSVKHQLDHKDMLYFLSYIQIEQVIQDNLLRLNNEGVSICNAVLSEVA